MSPLLSKIARIFVMKACFDVPDLIVKISSHSVLKNPYSFQKDVQLPQSFRGDLIAIRTASAYGEVMASAYNLRDRVGSVYERDIKDVMRTPKRPNKNLNIKCSRFDTVLPMADVF